MAKDKFPTPQNGLLISLETLFDATKRSRLWPTTETGEQKETLIAAYCEAFAQDPVTPVVWSLRAWMSQEWPVIIYSPKLPESMLNVVMHRVRAVLPDVDWASGHPLNLSIMLTDPDKGYFGPAVLLDAMMRARDCGGLALAHVDTKAAAGYLRNFFPNAQISSREG